MSSSPGELPRAGTSGISKRSFGSYSDDENQGPEKATIHDAHHSHEHVDRAHITNTKTFHHSVENDLVDGVAHCKEEHETRASHFNAQGHRSSVEVDTVVLPSEEDDHDAPRARNKPEQIGKSRPSTHEHTDQATPTQDLCRRPSKSMNQTQPDKKKTVAMMIAIQTRTQHIGPQWREREVGRGAQQQEQKPDALCERRDDCVALEACYS